MTTTYTTGSVADFDEMVAVIEAAADTAGYTTNIEPTPGASGDDAGDTLTLDWGNDFEVTIRSVVNLRGITIPSAWPGDQGPNIDGPGMMIAGAYTGGSLASEPPLLSFTGDVELSTRKYIGPQPTVSGDGADGTWVAPIFPATYDLFVHTDPDSIMLVMQTGAARFQWMIFGEIVKFGTWTGGGFYGASGVARDTDTGGASPSLPAYSLTGSSTNRSFAPFHRMAADFNRGHHANQCSNTLLHIITGTAEDDIDEFHWAFNMALEVGTLGGGTRPVREVVANPWWIPLASRSPNEHNEASVMLPYWLATQRELHRSIIGRLGHCRHIPVDNFNARDTFELGSDEWMVFPYFEREGITGLEGWAIRKNTGS